MTVVYCVNKGRPGWGATHATDFCHACDEENPSRDRASATSTRPAGATATRANVGFLLAKATQRWNELLRERFEAAGYGEVRPSYGSLLIPLWEEDALRMGELARRARLSKQTIATMVRLLERDGLVSREQDPADGRATVVRLTPRALEFKKVAEEALAELYDEVAGRLSPRGTERLEAALKQVAQL